MNTDTPEILDDEPIAATTPPKTEDAYPPNVMVGRPIGMKPQTQDVIDMRRLFKRHAANHVYDKVTGIKRPMTISDMISHCIRYTAANEGGLF